MKYITKLEEHHAAALQDAVKQWAALYIEMSTAWSCLARQWALVRTTMQVVTTAVVEGTTQLFRGHPQQEKIKR